MKAFIIPNNNQLMTNRQQRYLLFFALTKKNNLTIFLYAKRREKQAINLRACYTCFSNEAQLLNK